MVQFLHEFQKAASDKISFSNVFHVVSLRRHWGTLSKSDHRVIWAKAWAEHLGRQEQNDKNLCSFSSSFSPGSVSWIPVRLHKSVGYLAQENTLLQFLPHPLVSSIHYGTSLQSWGRILPEFCYFLGEQACFSLYQPLELARQ